MADVVVAGDKSVVEAWPRGHHEVIVSVFLGVGLPDFKEIKVPIRAVVVTRAYDIIHFLLKTETVGFTHRAVAIDRRCMEYSSIHM